MKCEGGSRKEEMVLIFINATEMIALGTRKDSQNIGLKRL